MHNCPFCTPTNMHNVCSTGSDGKERVKEKIKPLLKNDWIGLNPANVSVPTLQHRTYDKFDSTHSQDSLL